jgi:class 3 adenylate cyclase
VTRHVRGVSPREAPRSVWPPHRGRRQQHRRTHHTGEVELRDDDIGGIAVHIAQRVSALAGSSEIFVSRTVTDLVAGSGIEFANRGGHELKGVPGVWEIYAVEQ